MMDDIYLRTDPKPDAPAVPLHALTTRQRHLVTVIEQYHAATGEPCPASVLARRFSLHHSTIQKHLMVLHRKGWLRSPNAPARLTRWLE